MEDQLAPVSSTALSLDRAPSRIVRAEAEQQAIAQFPASRAEKRRNSIEPAQGANRKRRFAESELENSPANFELSSTAYIREHAPADLGLSPAANRNGAGPEDESMDNSDDATSAPNDTDDENQDWHSALYTPAASPSDETAPSGIKRVKLNDFDTERSAAMARLSRVRQMHASGAAVPVESEQSTKSFSCPLVLPSDPNGTLRRFHEHHQHQRIQDTRIHQLHHNFHHFHQFHSQSQHHAHSSPIGGLPRHGVMSPRGPPYTGNAPGPVSGHVQGHVPGRIQGPAPFVGPLQPHVPVAQPPVFGPVRGYQVCHAQQSVNESLLALLHPVHDASQQHGPVHRPHAASGVSNGRPLHFQHPHATLYHPPQPHPPQLQPHTQGRPPYLPRPCPHAHLNHGPGHEPRRVSGQHTAHLPMTAFQHMLPRAGQLIYVPHDLFAHPLPVPRMPAAAPVHSSRAELDDLEAQTFLEAQTLSLQESYSKNPVAEDLSEAVMPRVPKEKSPEGFTRSLKNATTANAVVCVGCDAPLMEIGKAWFIRVCGHLYCQSCSSEPKPECQAKHCTATPALERNAELFREVFL